MFVVIVACCLRHSLMHPMLSLAAPYLKMTLALSSFCLYLPSTRIRGAPPFQASQLSILILKASPGQSKQPRHTASLGHVSRTTNSCGQTAVSKYLFSSLHFHWAVQKKEVVWECQHRKGFIKQGLLTFSCLSKGKETQQYSGNNVATKGNIFAELWRTCTEFAEWRPRGNRRHVNDVNLPESTGSSRR